MTSENALHVVCGYGQIGEKLARRLAAEGHRVRVITRSALSLPAGLEHLKGDAADADFMREATRGARAIYHCINVPYQHWYETLPRIQASLKSAALQSGARYVLLDNLYMLGRPDTPMTEDSPLQPRSRKGELRARLERELFEAREREGLDLGIGRASDFFGPGVTSSGVFYPRNLHRLAQGKSVDVGGDPDAPHSYSYAPDVAEGLLHLGTAASLPSPVWHLPVAFQGTTRELLTALGRALGVDSQVNRMPGWMWALAGLFSPLVREAKEMVYQWEGPFIVDDGRFRARFGVQPTPLSDAVAQTAAWIRTLSP
ncbi:MAG: NAD-dependent epimerase/dehydratase family protein [Myxococcaceae bacterium]